MEKKSGRAWVALLAAALIRGFGGPGLNCCVGIFFPAVREELGLGVGALSLFVSVAAVAGMLSLPLAGRLYTRFGAARVAPFGVLLTAAPFLGLSLSRNLLTWCLPAVPFGVGTVLTVNLLGPVVVKDTFPASTGFSMGVMTAVASLVGAVMHPALTTLTARVGWRRTMFGCGAVTLLCMVPALFGLRGFSGKEKSETVSRDNGATPASKATPRHGWSMAGISLFLFGAVITFFNMFHQHLPTYARQARIDTRNIAAALAVSMLASAVGALAVGKWGDKHGALRGGLVLLGVGAASAVLFLLPRVSPAVFFFAAFLHGFASSGVGITVPALTRELFGEEEYTKILSRVMIGAPLATVVSMPLYGYFFDLLGSYRVPLFLLLAALGAAAAGLLLAAGRHRKIGAPRRQTVG